MSVMFWIPQRAGMSDCKLCTTPVDTSAKLSLEGEPMGDATHYRRLVGPVQYLTFTCPDIAYCCSSELLVSILTIRRLAYWLQCFSR
ncbi:hypothetical protein ACP70R_015022 [Stipagrostis hirtigluma subsp. patula]